MSQAIENKTKKLTPLFIECQDGSYLDATAIRIVGPDYEDKKKATAIHDDHGHEYLVDAPFDGVKAVLERHGITFASAADMRQTAKDLRAPKPR